MLEKHMFEHVFVHFQALLLLMLLYNAFLIDLYQIRLESDSGTPQTRQRTASSALLLLVHPIVRTWYVLCCIVFDRDIAHAK